MALYSNSIFFIDTDKINPNPFQPRREFDEGPLRDLSDSIRQYGVLQPLVVSRVEREKEDGSGLETIYELIAGERRLRAAKLAGVKQVPVIIREGDDSKMKLELAIIENLQREDLNAVDRARAFIRLVDEFNLTHAQVGQRMGKSREYVSNSLRILQMPQEILEALQTGKIMEGHTRPLMMLKDRPDEQQVLFKEIVYKKISVREAERIARRIAVERVRKSELLPTPEARGMEDELEERLGTRVHIERKADGGRITIDFFSDDDLNDIISLLRSRNLEKDGTMLERFEKMRGVVVPENLPSEAEPEAVINIVDNTINSFDTDVTGDFVPESELINEPISEQIGEIEEIVKVPEEIEEVAIVEKAPVIENAEDPELYSLSNFTV